jgi:hypothetical protein
LPRSGLFGVTASTLSALQTRIDAYRGAIGSPRVAKVKISTATELLETEWKRAGNGARGKRCDMDGVYPTG